MSILNRSSDGGRCSCPGTLARRSLVDSTAPRLVGDAFDLSLFEVAASFSMRLEIPLPEPTQPLLRPPLCVGNLCRRHLSGKRILLSGPTCSLRI